MTYLTSTFKSSFGCCYFPKVHILNIFSIHCALNVLQKAELVKKLPIPTDPLFSMAGNVLDLKDKAHVPIDFIFVLDC